MAKKKTSFNRTGISKPAAFLKKCKELGVKHVNLGHDQDGYYVYTHRARSKSYKILGTIPIRELKAIEATL